MENPFRVAGDVKLMSVSQRQMAAALGLSTTRINQLVTEKILVLDESRADGRLMLFESLQNYFLSKKTTSDGVNFWTERALHEKAKRELAELKVAQRKGELYEAARVEQFLAECIILFRDKLLGMGHKLAKRLEGKTAAQVCDIIDVEVTEFLEELVEDVENAEYKEAPADDSD